MTYVKVRNGGSGPVTTASSRRTERGLAVPQAVLKDIC